MKKIALILTMTLLAIITFGQATPSGQFRVATNNTAFGIDIPVGTEVICMTDTSVYVCHTPAASTLTLTTGATNFKKIAAGNSHVAVTLGSPANGLSLSGQQLSLGTASTSTTGALTSTDWNTFNNKLGSLITKVEYFSVSTTGSSAVFTLAHSKTDDALVIMNGFPLTSSQYTITGTTFTVSIPVYQYDRIQISYKY